MSESEIFLTARRLAPDQRDRYLEDACAGDADLRAQIEALLAADGERTGEFTAEAADPAAGEPLVSRGQMIGRYKLIEPIGEGGMGTVWRASQSEPVRREVALKLIKTGMDTRQILARFEQERQALAMMDHPNIAKVLDAGQTDQGRPYFAMELVRGVPITSYCDDHKLSPRERLQLFVQACQAVQHAHQKGIIHRDIKPSNVLVARYDDRPVVKVIDFGVAKAAGGGLTDETLHTAFGAIVGTLEYMAPEQAEFNALDIDTRADIYSLGVLLYELLTGSTPLTRHRMKKEGLSEVLRMIREDEPPRPSDRLSTTEELPSVAAVRATEPRQLSHLVRGDLDWIAMKALEKDRRRRYETANGLALDVQRFLADEPVAAGPPGTAYRLRKFVKRNRRTVVATAIVLITLVAGIVGTTWGWIRAIQERNDKEAARVQAVANEAEANRQKELARAGFQQAREAIDRAFTVVSEDRLLQVPGLQPLRKRLLEEALQYYRGFAHQWAGEPSLQRDLMHSYFRVAGITGEIGSKDQAIRDYRQAMQLCEALIRDHPEDAALPSILVTCHNNVGKLLMDQLKYPEALVEFEKCLTFPDDRALVRGNLALVLDQLGRRREAMEHLDAALAVRRRELEASPGDAELRHRLAGLLDSRGGLLRNLNRHAEAVDSIRQAIEQERLAIQAAPTALSYRAFLGNHFFNLALMYENHLNNPEEALAARRESVNVWDKLVAENPAVTEYRGSLAQACVDLGNTLQFRSRDKSEALAWFERARGHLQVLTRDFPDVAKYHSTLGAALDGIAYRQFDSKQLDQARQTLEDAIRHQRRAIELAPDLDQFHRFLATHLTNLASVYTGLNQPDRTLATLQQAIPVLERVVRESPKFPKSWHDLGTSHHKIGQLLAAKGQNDEAFRAHRRGVAVWRDQVRAQPANESAAETLNDACHQLARELVAAKRANEAAAVWEEEATFWEELLAKGVSPYKARVGRAAACLMRGELSVEGKDWPTALKWFETSRTEFQAAARDRADDLEAAGLLGRALKWIGDIHFLQKEPTRAAAAWTEALALYRTRLLPAEPDDAGRNATLGGLLHNIGRIHSDAGDHLKAADLFREAIRHQRIAFARRPAQSREWMNYHFEMLAETLRTLKKPDEAIAAIREWLAIQPDDADHLVRVAAEWSQCIPLLASDASRAASLAEESIACLKKAIQKGFNDMESLKKHSAFAPLRARAEYQKFLKDVPKSADPKPGSR